MLFLVDRNALAVQAENAFNDHLPDHPCYRVPRSGRRFQDEKRITIVTLQTMINEYANYSSGYFDLVITDECHRSIYGQWSGVLRHFDGIQIGLTATPCIAKDADELPDPEDGAFIKDTLRFFEVDRPTFRYTLPEAVAEGYLVPYRIYKAKTVKTAAEEGFPVRRDELDWTAMDDATRQELEELFGTSEIITVDPSALERRFTIPERNRAMVREFREVLDRGFTGQGWRAPGAAVGQDHRLRRDQAPRRDARPDARSGIRRQEARRPRALCGLRGVRPGTGGHGRRPDQDQALQG